MGAYKVSKKFFVNLYYILTGVLVNRYSYRPLLVLSVPVFLFYLVHTHTYTHKYTY